MLKHAVSISGIVAPSVGRIIEFPPATGNGGRVGGVRAHARDPFLVCKVTIQGVNPVLIPIGGIIDGTDAAYRSLRCGSRRQCINFFYWRYHCITAVLIVIYRISVFINGRDTFIKCLFGGNGKRQRQSQGKCQQNCQYVLFH